MYAFYYDKDPDDLFTIIEEKLENTNFSNSLVFIGDSLDSITNSLNSIGDSLDIIYLNGIFCLFLLSCVLSILCNKKQNKGYIVVNTVEPRVIKGEIVNKI